MAYTDYEFYANKFFGSAIPADNFLRYAERASEKLDRFTFDRLTDGLPEDDRSASKIQKAVCAAAELLCEIEQFRTQAENAGGYELDDATGKLVGKIVSGKSSGSESISFTAGTSDLKNSSLVGAVLSDKQAQDRLLYDTMKEYLEGIIMEDGTPLLYAGV